MFNGIIKMSQNLTDWWRWSGPGEHRINILITEKKVNLLPDKLWRKTIKIATKQSFVSLVESYKTSFFLIQFRFWANEKTNKSKQESQKLEFYNLLSTVWVLFCWYTFSGWKEHSGFLYNWWLTSPPQYFPTLHNRVQVLFKEINRGGVWALLLFICSFCLPRIADSLISALIF